MSFEIFSAQLHSEVSGGKVRSHSPHSKLVSELREFLTLKKLWAEYLLEDIPKHWERHGDLLVFPHTAFRNSVWHENGHVVYDLITKVLGCKRLAQKSKVLSDGYRTPQVKLLKGNDGWVQRTDNGIKFTFDVTRCMFSFGNITEKLRIAQFECSGETVVDMYAGIGYFTLPFLVHAKADHVHACEWNPKAVEALKRNLALNKIDPNRYTIHEGDNREAGLSDLADRVNLGLLPSSRNGWITACGTLRRKSGGILHLHENVDSPLENRVSDLVTKTNAGLCSEEKSYLSEMRNDHRTKKTKWLKKCSIRPEWLTFANETCKELKEILDVVHRCCWTTNVLHIECVKFYAPHVAHIVVDIECRPASSSALHS